MTLAIVAEPEPSERARCVSVLANQPLIGALGVRDWQELEQALEGDCEVGLIVYSVTLLGAPEDALERLAKRNCPLAIIAEPDVLETVPDGATRQSPPITGEALVLLARAAERQGSDQESTFRPADLIQVLCMSHERRVLVLSHEESDVGVVEIRDGAVWTAYDSLGVGVSAFTRLMHPAMRARPSRSQVSVQERTIFAGHEELILEAVRLIDEGRVSVPPPLSTPVPSAPAPTVEPSPEIVELEAQARRHLTDRDYNRATRVLAALAELDPNSTLVLANLAQLHSLGYPDD